MDRLTSRCKTGVCGTNDRITLFPLYRIGDRGMYQDKGLIQQCFNRLAEYEDTGLTPKEIMAYKIKEGATVYYVPDKNAEVLDQRIHEWEIINRETIITWIEAGEIGKHLFLTREDAERALKGVYDK